MAIKTPYYNENLPKLNFPWALKISDFDEILLVSGHADVKHDNATANYPNDLMGQLNYILDQISNTISNTEFTIDDVIRREITLSKEVSDEKLPDLFQRLAEYFDDVDVKPAGGTLRFVDRLISRECLIEIELMLAR